MTVFMFLIIFIQFVAVEKKYYFQSLEHYNFRQMLRRLFMLVYSQIYLQMD